MFWKGPQLATQLPMKNLLPSLVLKTDLALSSAYEKSANDDMKDAGDNLKDAAKAMSRAVEKVVDKPGVVQEVEQR